MQEGLRFAAIDVGSNAMRLFFCRVLENGDRPTFIKESMIKTIARKQDVVFHLLSYVYLILPFLDLFLKPFAHQ